MTNAHILIAARAMAIAAEPYIANADADLRARELANNTSAVLAFGMGDETDTVSESVSHQMRNFGMQVTDVAGIVLAMVRAWVTATSGEMAVWGEAA